MNRSCSVLGACAFPNCDCPLRPESETPETDSEEFEIPPIGALPARKVVEAWIARSLERRLSLAQTEIKEYQAKHTAIMREADRRYDELVQDIEQGFMQGAYARLKNLQNAERQLEQAQARIAELEKALAELHREWEADILAATDLRQDAARYRWLRDCTDLNRPIAIFFDSTKYGS
jgi:hypothetical protein